MLEVTRRASIARSIERVLGSVERLLNQACLTVRLLESGYLRKKLIPIWNGLSRQRGFGSKQRKREGWRDHCSSESSLHAPEVAAIQTTGQVPLPQTLPISTYGLTHTRVGDDGGG